jgi:hypothetical protein
MNPSLTLLELTLRDPQAGVELFRFTCEVLVDVSFGHDARALATRPAAVGPDGVPVRVAAREETRYSARVWGDGERHDAHRWPAARLSW